MDDDQKKEPEGFSRGTIMFAFSLFGVCLLLLTPTIMKAMKGPAPEVVRGPEVGIAQLYEPGMTTCGTEHDDSELIAAIGKKHWKAPNPKKDKLCEKRILIKETVKGKKDVVAFVKDKCLECGMGDIKLSSAAFQSLGKIKEGQLPVTWEFVD